MNDQSGLFFQDKQDDRLVHENASAAIYIEKNEESDLAKQKIITENSDELKIYYEKILGKGSFSKVFPGKYRGNTVAVKIISTKHLKPYISQQLHREEQVIRILQKNPHKNIAKYHKIFNEEDKMIIVMELCSGGELTKYIKPGLDLDTVRDYFGQILKGYKHLLSLDIVHRDIKSANILLSHDKKTIKFIDFGLSKLFCTDLSQTICGSPLYMAPELLNHQNYDSKSDIWSLGVLLYEMVYGITPFHQCKVIKTLKEMIQTDSIDYPKMSSKNLYIVPNELVTYIKNLLQLEPSQRIDWDNLSEAGWLQKPIIDNANDTNCITKKLSQKKSFENENIAIIENYKRDLSMSEVEEKIHSAQIEQKNLNHQRKKANLSHKLSSSPIRSHSKLSKEEYEIIKPIKLIEPLRTNKNQNNTVIIKPQVTETNKNIRDATTKNKSLNITENKSLNITENKSLNIIDRDVSNNLRNIPKISNLQNVSDDDIDSDDMGTGSKNKRSSPIPIKQNNKKVSHSNHKQNYGISYPLSKKCNENQQTKNNEQKCCSFDNKMGTTSNSTELKIDDISVIDNRFDNNYSPILKQQKTLATNSGLIDVNDVNDLLIATIPEKTTAYEYISSRTTMIGSYLYSRSAPIASTIFNGLSSFAIGTSSHRAHSSGTKKTPTPK
jgi:serine/threonine protein kinase